MRIRIKQTTLGSPDGITVNEYLAGVETEIADDLAAVFVREGWGEEVVEVAPTPPAAPGPTETNTKRPPHKGK